MRPWRAYSCRSLGNRVHRVCEETDVRDRPRRAVGARRGFTLVEMLAVIAIITVLVAILVPTLDSAREMAKRAICMMNERTVLSSATSYATDHASKYPPAPPHWYQRVKLGADNFYTMGTMMRSGYLPKDEAHQGLYFCASGKATWNWQSFEHLYYGVILQPGSNVECYITYAARFTPIDKDEPLTLENASQSPPLLADYVYNDNDPAAAGWNSWLYWGDGSIQAHKAEGLNVGFHDTSARWIPFEGVEWAGGASWLGKYNVHYNNGNMWHWVRQEYYPG